MDRGETVATKKGTVYTAPCAQVQTCFFNDVPFMHQESAASRQCTEAYQMEEMKKPANKRESNPANKCQAYFDQYKECMKLTVTLSRLCDLNVQNEERRRKNAGKSMFG